MLSSVRSTNDRSIESESDERETQHELRLLGTIRYCFAINDEFVVDE